MNGARAPNIRCTRARPAVRCLTRRSQAGPGELYVRRRNVVVPFEVRKSMPKTRRPQTDKAREERITMEIIVDAYDEAERALGWYYYLEQQLQFPFTAQCIALRSVSPLEVGDEVTVIGMPPEEECEHEMFVTIEWGKRGLAVPLSQLRGVALDEETRRGIEDWHYWVKKGYQF